MPAREGGQPEKHGNGARALQETLALLREGTITLSQPLPWGSNYDFAILVEAPAGEEVIAIYKPARGEAPLWDFERGTLYRREYAAYLVSAALGWDIVPPTVTRDGPEGVGSVQLYIEPADEYDFRALRQSHAHELRRMALFDLIINNADRKVSHLLKAADGHLWGIDHGLTFHTVPKLRTVIWDCVGEPVPAPLLSDLEQLIARKARLDPLLAELRSLLTPAEIDAFLARIKRILRRPVYPLLDAYRNTPRGF